MNLSCKPVWHHLFSKFIIILPTLNTFGFVFLRLRWCICLSFGCVCSLSPFQVSHSLILMALQLCTILLCLSNLLGPKCLDLHNSRLFLHHLSNSQQQITSSHRCTCQIHDTCIDDWYCHIAVWWQGIDRFVPLKCMLRSKSYADMGNWTFFP